MMYSRPQKKLKLIRSTLKIGIGVGMILIFPRFVYSQSYPFNLKESMYHKGWIDLNKNGKMDPYENPKLSVEQRIGDLLDRMTIDEKTVQLVTLYGYGAVLKDPQPTKAWLDTTWKDGIGNIDEHLNGKKKYGYEGLFWPPSRHAKAINNVQRFFIEQTRLGIPVDFSNEGIRGLKAYKATSFPVEIGQGSTWDPQLINDIGKVEGREARALGYTNVYSPEVDVARDPRWGRTLATYGEDPYLTSKFGVAMVKGLQSEHVVSTLKHFAVYSVPKGGRDGSSRTDPHVTPRELHTMFLPPFKNCVEAGALGVMSSYNDYNGIPVTGSYYFLTMLLRQKWGFKGYIITDSGALLHIYSKHHVQKSFKGAIIQAIEAGVNIRTNFKKPYKFLVPLREAVKSGDIPIHVINERVRDVLRVKYWLGLFDDPYVSVKNSDKLVNTAVSHDLSLRAAEESLVLLKNSNNLLPLKKDSIHSILVTGPNANMSRSLINGYGPKGVNVTTVLEGIKAEVAKGTRVTYVKGTNVRDANFPESDIIPTPLNREEEEEIKKAVDAAKHSDVAVIVVGENKWTGGEGRSRISLNLPGHQLKLVKAIYKTGTPTIVVLVNGRPLTINWIDSNVPSILEAWYPGARAGEAIAKALFGEYNPGGKLPITFPKAVGQVPLNFPYMPASQIYTTTAKQNEKETRVAGPLYPFGYGLSYTRFKYSNLKIKKAKGRQIEVSLNVKNTGKRKGDEIVQLYLHEKTTPVITPVSRLRGFKRITLKPDQSMKVTFKLTTKDMEILNKDLKPEVVPGTFVVMIGKSSVDIKLRGSFQISKHSFDKSYHL